MFKKGKKDEVTNYRPISLLSLVSKITERCVCDKLFDFIADRIRPLQHGFVKGRSTVTQLLDTVHRLTKAIDQGYQTDVTFLDFSKAFDSVSHSLLIRKLISTASRVLFIIGLLAICMNNNDVVWLMWCYPTLR